MKILRSIEAMAIINPQLCKQKTIQVEVEQRNEGMLPHLHVYHDKTRNPRKCSYIRLDKPAYSEHHKNGKKLPRDLKKEFIEVMSTPWKSHVVEDVNGIRTATGYEAAVSIWSETFEDGSLDRFSKDENGNLIMPDYKNEL